MFLGGLMLMLTRIGIDSNGYLVISPTFAIGLTFFPDSRTAWGDWIGIDPDRGDVFGNIVIYLLNMAGRIMGLELNK